MKSLLFLILFSGVVTMAKAEKWRSELYPESWAPPTEIPFTEKMIQDFSHAGYQSGSALPKSDQGTDVTKAPYFASSDGTDDATDAIQKAIDDVGLQGGGVVYLPEGLFRISASPDVDAALFLRHNHITLKGAGAGKTFLFNTTVQMHKKDIIRISGAQKGDWRTPTGEVISITRDLLTPTTVIPVKDASSFAPGDWVVIRSRPTNKFVTEHRMGGPKEWLDQEDSLRGIMFYRQIVGVDQTKQHLHIDIPTRYALKTRDEAMVHKSLTHREHVGIEDLSIGNLQHPATEGWGDYDYKEVGTAAFHVNQSAALHFWLARNCWVKGVHSFRSKMNRQDYHLLSNGIRIQYSRSLTFKDCDFQRPQFRGGGGNGYMYQIRGQECLFQNCASRYCRHGFIFLEMQTSGNVIHRCTAEHSGFNSKGKGNDHHTHLSHSNLIDSAVVIKDFFESKYRNKGSVPIHGITGTQSVFWNIEGKEFFPKRPYIVHSQQFGWGYIIGTQGAAPTVLTSGEHPEKTDPIDWVEGEGKGASLEPASLYEDQLQKQRGTIPRVILRTSTTSPKPGDDVAIILETSTPEEIQRCDLYVGSRPLGTFTHGKLIWKSATAGSHRIIASVTTHKGNRVLSEPLDIQVKGIVANYPLNRPEDGKIFKDLTGEHDALSPKSLTYEKTSKGSAPLFKKPVDVIELPKGIVGTDSLSVNFWFQTGDSSRQGFLYYGAEVDGGNGYGNENELHVHMKKGGRLQLFIEGGERDVSLSSKNRYDDNQWHHLAITVEKGNVACLYVDGRLESNAEYSAEPFPFSGCHQLGRPNAPDRNYRGAIDSLEIRNDILSLADIAERARRRP